MQTWLIILTASVLLVSAISYGFYALDKRRASRRGWRVPESRLHLLALLGGWPGAWLAQNRLRHKTQKTSFRIIFWLTVTGHVAIALMISWLIMNG